jgi:hypothetical protein
VVKLQSCPFGKNLPGPVWYTIYPHLPVVKGASSDPLLINQLMGKGHLWVKQTPFPSF